MAERVLRAWGDMTADTTSQVATEEAIANFGLITFTNRHDSARANQAFRIGVRDGDRPSHRA
jgi:hypothetical protein